MLLCSPLQRLQLNRPVSFAEAVGVAAKTTSGIIHQIDHIYVNKLI
jgi:hypothetical protein